MARLEAVCRIIVDGDWIESKDQSECGIRLIQTGNIGVGEYLEKYNRAKYISAETFQRLKCTEVLSGDILISRLPDPVGRACAVPKYVGKAIAAVDCTIVRLNNSLCDANYFINYTQSVRYSNELSKFLAGTTRTRISRKNLEKIEIPLPSLDEQHKIAAVLDKVSDLIAKRRQQLDKLDELIKARFVEMFGDCVNNAKGWDTYSFDQCFDIVSSKRILKSEWKTAGIPFLRVRDMVQLATTGNVDNEFFVSEEFYASLSDSDGIPQEGDILVSATSTLGKCYIVNKGECFYFKDADVLRFRAKKEINPIFFIEQMKTRYIEEQIEKTLGVTTVAHFTIKAAKTINMRYPNIELQNQFAIFAKRAEKLKTTISRSLNKLDTLKNALMQEYFG